jgi:hypothetical protein
LEQEISGAYSTRFTSFPRKRESHKYSFIAAKSSRFPLQISEFEASVSPAQVKSMGGKPVNEGVTA